MFEESSTSSARTQTARLSLLVLKGSSFRLLAPSIAWIQRFRSPIGATSVPVIHRTSRAPQEPRPVLGELSIIGWNSDVPLSGDLALMAALYQLRELLTDDLPEVATKALVDGLDSPSLRQLAGATTNNAFELEELLRRSLDELGLGPATEETARQVLARHRAEQIVRGEIDPPTGAGRMWRTFLPDYPDAVMPFLQLEDMYHDVFHAKERDRIAAEIIEEAKKYLNHPSTS